MTIEPSPTYKALKKRLPSALPPLQELYVWLQTEGARCVRFCAKDECQCPLAQFLSDRFKAPIEVGDDDLSYDGLFLCECPRDYRSFIREFDVAYEVLDEVSATDVLELFKSNAKDWRIEL